MFWRYLDTSPYNSHTTLAEASWAGVPAISMPMDSIVSRTGASMLKASGLEGLIVHDYLSYKKLAIALATDKNKLAQYRSILFSNRVGEATPFFNNLQWTRDWEDVLLGVWEKEVSKKKQVRSPTQEANGGEFAAFGVPTMQQASSAIFFGENTVYEVQCDGLIC